LLQPSSAIADGRPVEAVADSIPIGRPPFGARLFHNFVFFFFYLVVGILTAVGVSSLDEPGKAGIVFLVVGALVGLVVELLRRAHWKEIQQGTLSIVGDELVIDHPPLLRDPLVVPLADILALAVEETEEARTVRVQHGLADDVRFPVLGEAGGPLRDKVRGHCSSAKDAKRTFPTRRLGQGVERPNVLMLFANPA
jgi:hypothetical protein